MLGGVCRFGARLGSGKHHSFTLLQESLGNTIFLGVQDQYETGVMALSPSEPSDTVYSLFTEPTKVDSWYYNGGLKIRKRR